MHNFMIQHPKLRNYGATILSRYTTFKTGSGGQLYGGEVGSFFRDEMTGL
jgi:hypothetical protein